MKPLLPAETPESGSFGPRCWKPEEDELLRQAVRKYGAGKWALAANLVPERSNHQCRQRWFFYLDPKINKDPLTDEEYEIILNDKQGSETSGSTSLKCFLEGKDHLRTWVLRHRFIF
jgi:hypothetical protein